MVLFLWSFHCEFRNNLRTTQNKQTFIGLWQPLTKAGLHKHSKLHTTYIRWYWNYCPWFTMREFYKAKTAVSRKWSLHKIFSECSIRFRLLNVYFYDLTCLTPGKSSSGVFMELSHVAQIPLQLGIVLTVFYTEAKKDADEEKKREAEKLERVRNTTELFLFCFWYTSHAHTPISPPPHNCWLHFATLLTSSSYISESIKQCDVLCLCTTVRSHWIDMVTSTDAVKRLL